MKGYTPGIANDGIPYDEILNHSAGKHDRGPLFLHYFHLDSSEVVQLVQFKGAFTYDVSSRGERGVSKC